MPTLTLATIRTLTRDELNELTEINLLTTELTVSANDGYKDTAVKALCNEIVKPLTLVSGQKIYRIPTTSPLAFKVVHVEIGGIGQVRFQPQQMGSANATVAGGSGATLYWFQWGGFIIFEPTPNAATAAKETNLFCACYPAAALAADADIPSSLPVECHESVFEFTLVSALVKLKRWNDAANAYNRYIGDVQRKRFEYIHRRVEPAAAKRIPDNVVLEIKQ